MHGATGPTIGSLFSGYGGLDQATRSVFGGRVLWHCENDPAPSAVLAHHYPDVPNLGDITAVDWATVPPVDLLTGGFPCTDLSVAGARQGLASARSGLWWHMHAAIAALRPRLVVIENVRGLLTARGAAPTDELIAAEAEAERLQVVLRGITNGIRRNARDHARRHRWEALRVRYVGLHRRAVAAVRRADARIVRAVGAVLGSLADLGYDAAWCGLRAAAVGAPHGRYRIFIVAWPASDAVGGGRDGWPGAPGAGRWDEPAHRGGAAPHAGRDARPEAHQDDDAPARRGGDAATDAHGHPVRQQPVGVVGRGGASLAGVPGADAPADPEGLRREAWWAEPERDPRGSRPAQLGAPPADPDGGGLGPDQLDLRAGQPDPRRGAPADTDSGRRQERPELEREPHGAGEGELGDDADGLGMDWGPYGPAIHRWEGILGRPAPAPTEPGTRGQRRLSPVFVEWMMGVPAGHVTAVPGVSRGDQLKMLGNGVVPQQAEAALRHLLPLIVAATRDAPSSPAA